MARKPYPPRTQLQRLSGERWQLQGKIAMSFAMLHATATRVGQHDLAQKLRNIAVMLGEVVAERYRRQREAILAEREKNK